MADKLNKIVEGTINKISQQSIDENNLYQFEDYPVGGITNEQMTNALASSQSGFYQTNSVYMCIDEVQNSAYIKDHCYKFTPTAWVDITPWNNTIETTLSELSQGTVDNSAIYSISDYPIGGITNSQMAAALTQAQNGFYQANAVYMCIDGGEGKTYLKNHFYRFNIISWEDVTPQFAGKIEEKTLQELESTTIEDSTLYAIDDYPLGGITQAQMTDALKITQRGFYKVNSVYLCVDGDGTSTYIKNHFYRFSYDETTDTYSWVDTKAGADVDSVLSLESENPVQNKVITENLNNKVSKTGDENIYGIKSFDVRPKLGIGDILPNEYQEVEYVELMGSQYINTIEQIWNTSKYTNWKIDFDFTPTATYDYNAIFGTANAVTTFESWIAADKNFYFRYNGNKQTVSTITPNTRYNFIADYTPSTLTFTINGTSRSISQSAGNIASALYVGRRDTNYGKFKIHSLKLYGNDNLIKQFIPCYRKSDAVIGLYDTVSSTFFTNSGTGVFLKGENVYRGVDFATVEDITTTKQELQTQIDDKVSLTKNEVINGQKIFAKRPQVGEVRLPNEFTEVEYIETTGAQYINLGLTPSQAVTNELELSFRDTPTSRACILGVYENVINYPMEIFDNGGLKFCYRVTNNRTFSSITPTADAKYKIKTTLKTNSQVMYINDTLAVSSNIGISLSSWTYYLFAVHTSESPNPNFYTSARLYSYKIYSEDGGLIRDFVPCYTNQQVTNNNVTYEANTIGLYDTVNNIFYVNNGTGTFIKGQNILAGEYIALQSELPIANPTTTAESPNLTSITIKGTDYKIAGGGSGGDYIAGNGINITDKTISADTNVLATKEDIPAGETDITFNGTPTTTTEDLSKVVIGDTTYLVPSNTEVNAMKVTINNSLQLPKTAPTATELVGIGTNKSQVNVGIGSGLSLENGTLKVTSGENSSYNPNLLLNDEMTINQRGKSVYYGPSTYGTDRWMCVDESAFMRLNSSSQWAIGLEDTDSAGERIAIKQIIENYQSLKGQTVTLTLSYSNLTESVSGTTQLTLYDGVKTETVALTSSGTAILTATISSNADRVEVRIKTSATGTDTSLVFKYCKLELGGSSTPLAPKNIGLALTECQRYYQKLSTFGCSNIPTTATSFDAPINLFTSLRATPTLKLSAKPLIIGNGSSISSTSYSISSLKNNKAIINLQCTQSMTLNQVYVLSDVIAELDAEIY